MDEKERKKLEAKLYQLLLELLHTERTYVADLVKVNRVTYLAFLGIFLRKFFLYLKCLGLGRLLSSLGLSVAK